MLQAPDGEFDIRIASGLVIGEDEQGNFVIAPTEQTALVRFELEDGAVHIHIVSRNWALTRNDRMVGDSLRNERTAELHLPNNVIRIVGGENPAAEPECIELTRRVSMRWLLPTPERTEVSPAGAVETCVVPATEDITEPQIGQSLEKSLEDLDNALAAAQPSSRSGQHKSTISIDPADRPGRRPAVRRQRVASPLMAALIGVGGGIGIALLYQTLSKPPIAAPAADATPSTIQAPTLPLPHLAEDALVTNDQAVREATVPEGSVKRSPEPEGETVAAAAVEPAVSASDVDEKMASNGPARPLPPASVEDAPPTTERKSREEVADGTSERSPEPRQIAASVERVAPAPVERLPAPVERRPTPQVAQTGSAAAAVPNLQNTGSQPQPVVAKQQQIEKIDKADLAKQARAAEQARLRLLRAADVALGQGRLMTPPETSAYTFYKRILALDPKSEEANNGLKSVRQGLINRTLAQLATGALDDARSSLQGAADAGVNPELVADLRGEVEYRQRLSDARAGHFETLYPVDQLVAISRQPPRLPRGVAKGAETFVEVQFTVSTGGEVRDVEVLNAPPEKLERAVRRAVDEWRFEPVLYKGRPMPVRSSVRFDLRN